MIDVTVKTLDSQNHRYSVPDDITVKQFKDRIAASVSIPPDKQRLIYCGRVLQDDKNLSEYNVHEKVIHLVMRAPPQVSSRTNGSASSSGDSGQQHRGSHRPSRSDGRHVLFGSIVVPEDALEDLTAAPTRGPSSSGVRLQQAKTMLDRASEVLDQLEELFSSSSEPSTSSSPSNQSTEAQDEAAGATGGSDSTVQPESSEGVKEKPKGFDCSKRLHTPESLPTDELENLYSEMDALNNTYNSIDTPMMAGSQMLPQMGPPFMGAISTSLAGGLAHAASAAFASAFSSMSTSGTTTSSSSSDQQSMNDSSARPQSTHLRNILHAASSASRLPTSAPSASSTGTDSPPSGQPPVSTPSSTASAPSGSQSHNSVRGITVRITNRAQRSPGIRLEHPRCSVIVDVLDQYQNVQQRLQPFLTHYYRTLTNDQAYENVNDRQLQADQYLLWRVSSVLHFVSHATHAISDIIIDLRRNPPRQLRARPIIIPQPAIVQAQINVSPNTDLSSRTMNRTAQPARSSNTTTSEMPSAPSASESTTRVSSSSAVPPTSSPNRDQPSIFAASNATGGLPRNLLELDDGVVVMHVGPNGFTIDSLTSETSSEDSAGNPPPELLQNLMSSLTSQLGMSLGGNINTGGPPNAPSTTPASSTSPPPTPGGVRNAAPVHNSQATGNSGTNTTNATQTRVTPRPHVHVTPLHVPGMGMTQFDPFLPCQSHHIRPSAARRRHRTTNQTAASSSELNNRQQASEPVPSTPSSNSPESERTDIPAHAATEDFFTNFMTSVLEDLSEEQQQENMFMQLVRGVMAEVCGSLGTSRESGNSEHQDNQQHTSLQDFLEPFSNGGFFSDMERDNFFAQLFHAVSQSLSMRDLVQLFFGDSQRLNHLQQPLRQFLQEQVLRGAEPTEVNMDRAIDDIIMELDPHLVASAGDAVVNDGIDYVHTIHNFIRQRLQDIFALILGPGERETFGLYLFTILQRSFREFIAISIHCLSDGVQGLERLVESRVQSIMSGMRPAIQTWSVNTSLMQLRAMMSHLAITEEQIRQFIVSPDEGRRMKEAIQNRISRPVSHLPTTVALETPEENGRDSDHDNSDDNYVEAMEVDDVGGIEEVTTSETMSAGAIANDEPSVPVAIGSQNWHSAVPQEWIPVITRDVERQRRGVPDTNLSDAYLCGMPLKRRKLSAQNKPHGTVQQVMQDTLRQSLRTSGVNRTLIETVSGEVSHQLGDVFVSHVRSVLREQLENNQDFKPEKFPKSEQKIRKKWEK